MSSAIQDSIPTDYAARIKGARGARGLTQTQFADLLGVSFASINRWENSQSRPAKLAWLRVLELERELSESVDSAVSDETARGAVLDFAADPEAVVGVAEAHRLAYGHMFNSAFATETSLIDPLPHQRIAVYEHMLAQSPLRFLLADDAGAGKTIMSGLYVREMLSRRVIRRVLIVPPAGLVGNWEREMRTLFRLQFRIFAGADARYGNPFAGPESDLAIVSIDTIAGDRMFSRLQEAATLPYDLVIFDEAHKLSADREPDFRVRKTGRYRVAEALAGIRAEQTRWRLDWSATHVLLLTATPHMGKDYPYYALWRLLLPDVLSTYEAFAELPASARPHHFIRRTKEEMVRFDGSPLYPQRTCDTLSYDLTQGPDSEQELYDETTEYIRHYYNRARILNRSAARLAMSVFQRRLASSTYGLTRSFERRIEKLKGWIEAIRSGQLSEEQLLRQQRKLDRDLRDAFDERTADEDATDDGEGEEHEGFEDEALGVVVAVNLAELINEKAKVEALLKKARRLVGLGQESKFDKLREVLRNPRFAQEKLIIFTEHRDTANFLVRRLGGLGFTGQVALIHGGLPYREREKQVEFFRTPADGGGANYLVATDAAGEGINLQFCWLMVNYDIPWNPARLEQRMGRIHRYGQKHDPVIIINLVAGTTREGRVLKTLLDKLEAIRKQLRSDKVFDVVGRLFEGISIKDYLERALTDEGADEAAQALTGRLTEGQVTALAEKEHRIYGEGGDVSQALPQLNETMAQETYRRLLPGYVNRFVERAAPLLGLRIEGDLDGTFTLAPDRPRALDPLLTAIESYPGEAQGRITVLKPANRHEAIWLHPGEAVFDRISATIIDRFRASALRGAVFIDPTASEPYLFHLAQISVEQASSSPEPASADLFAAAAQGALPSHILESRLIGLRQTQAGEISECPVEHLLLLRGAPDFPPSRVPLASLAHRLLNDARVFAEADVADRLAESHRQHLFADLPARREFIVRGFDHQMAELTAARSRLTEKARAGDPAAQADLTRIKDRQRNLLMLRDQRLAEIEAEPRQIHRGDVRFLAHALVVPSADPEDRKRYDAEVEVIAVKVATAFEEGLGARVHDVSRPELARRAGLNDWPGFDLWSHHPETGRRAIEVKGRAGVGEIEVSDNEWAKACTLRHQYWLYVVFDCATPRPRLVRVRDPFGALLTKAKGGVIIDARSVFAAAESETAGGIDH